MIIIFCLAGAGTAGTAAAAADSQVLNDRSPANCHFPLPTDTPSPRHRAVSPR